MWSNPEINDSQGDKGQFVFFFSPPHTTRDEYRKCTRIGIELRTDDTPQLIAWEICGEWYSKRVNLLVTDTLTEPINSMWMGGIGWVGVEVQLLSNTWFTTGASAEEEGESFRQRQQRVEWTAAQDEQLSCPVRSGLRAAVASDVLYIRSAVATA